MSAKKSQTESLQLAINGCFMKIFNTICKETVLACMDICGSFTVYSVARYMKIIFLPEFILKKKSVDLCGQFAAEPKPASKS